MKPIKNTIPTETPPKMALKKQLPVSIAAALLTLGASSVSADIVHLDDVIIDGSLCVGFDCVNGEAFGFDTIRLKENNTRIKADDTSNSASFPNWDWQLTFNDSSNGGANKFSIDDISGGRTPFTIEGNAPSHSLYVEDGGRVGLGTSIPVVELHVVDGDTPTVRLEQDGSSGFAPQTWDLAGNETNFFVRDVTNGSALPFRIRPSAPTSSIDIEGSTGDVGVGTSSPAAALHVRRTNGNAKLLVEEASGTTAARQLVELSNNGDVSLRLNDTTGTRLWDLTNNGVSMNMSLVGSGGSELVLTDTGALFIGPGSTNNLALTSTGDLSIAGTLTVNAFSTGETFPDYVFEPDYPLRSMEDLAGFIQENGHLPNVPSQEDVREQGGINMTKLQLSLLEKVEELTLYTLDQHKTISELQARLATLESGGDRQ